MSSRPSSPSPSATPPPPPYKDPPYAPPAPYLITTTTTTTTVTQTQTHQHALFPPLFPLLRRKSIALLSPERERDQRRPSIDREALMSKPLPPSPQPSPHESPAAPALTLTPSSPPTPAPPVPLGPAEHFLPSPPSNTPTTYLAHASLFPLQGLGLPPALPPPPTLSPHDPLSPNSPESPGKRFSIRRAKSFDRGGAPASPGRSPKALRPKRPRTATLPVPASPETDASPSSSTATAAAPSPTQHPQPRKSSFASRTSIFSRRPSLAPSPAPSPAPAPVPSLPSSASTPTPTQPPSSSPSRSSTTPSSPLRTPSGLLPPFQQPVERKLSSSFLRLGRSDPDGTEKEDRGRRRASTLFGSSPGRQTPPALPTKEKDADSEKAAEKEKEREKESRTRSSTLDSLASLAQSFPWAGRNSVLIPSPAPGAVFAEPATPPSAGAVVRKPSLSRLGPHRRRTESGRGLAGVLEGLVEGRVVGPDEERREERERGGRTEEEREMEVELDRLVRTVGRTDLASVLCGTPLLPLHLSRLTPSPFPLPPSAPLPLDVALRVLLMHLALPKETQAIDRVVEAFAVRWAQAYAGLVTSDQAYLLAFSLIMLHTDHFNKSNKRKMSREDYVRNTKGGGGVSEVVLEYLYDNITFAPFIFIEDSTDVNGQRTLSSSSSSPSPTTPLTSTSTLGKKGKRVDIYYLISQGRLDPLRAQVETFVPARNPLSFVGTEELDMGPWVEQCHEAFAGASEVYVDLMNGAGGIALGGGGSEGGPEGGMVVKLTKVGAMLRKDDFLPPTSKKPPSSSSSSRGKWRNFGIAITGSQLLFFKDPHWIAGLKEAADDAKMSGGAPPKLQAFKPDEWVSLREAVAVWDGSYDKFENVFRLVLPHGRHYLFQASSPSEVNDWLARINYAASFKTAGVRMRSAGMTSRQLGLAALAAAESHVRDVKSSTPGRVSPVPSARGVISLDDEPFTQTDSPLTSPDSVDPSPPTDTASSPSLCDPADQLEATFREIKAELAASHQQPGMVGLGLGLPSALTAARSSPSARAQSLFVNPSVAGEKNASIVRSSSLGLMQQPPSANSSGEFSIRKGWLALRSDVIQRKVLAFEHERRVLEPQLEAELRQARNLAVLTPFQRSTRDRIQAAVQPLAKRVAQLRMEITRLRCYSEVLTADLDAEKREWAEARRVAFDAAEARLGSTARTLRVDVPRMTLSMHLESPKEFDSTFFNNSTNGRPLSHRRPSSATTNGSYHSAIDTQEMAWPTPEESPAVETPRSLFRSPSSIVGGSSAASSEGMLARPMEEGRSEPISYPFPSQQATTPVNGTDSPSSLVATPGSPDEDVQAEDWTSTRVAKRVSLVQIPSAGLHPRDRIAEELEEDEHRRSVLDESIVEGDSFEESAPN